MTPDLDDGDSQGRIQRARSMPLNLERQPARLRRVSDNIKRRLPVSRVPSWLLVTLVAVGLVWLVAVTAALLWMLLEQRAPTLPAPDDDAATQIVERIHERGRAMQRKLLRIPLLSAVYVIVAPYAGVLMGLAGPQARLLLRWINNLIPTLRKAQGYYVVVFWFNKIKQAQLLTRAGSAIKLAQQRALSSLTSRVQPSGPRS
eukprot:624020-Prymnesium_polylepis.1